MRGLNSKKRGKGKKGISPLIGYVLLVVFAVVISSIVFQWLRTYVPAQAMECPDGVSLFLNAAIFNNETRELNLTITNNGRFSIDGYFVNIKNDSEQDLAVIGIWNYLDEGKSFPAKNFSGSVSFNLKEENSFQPQDQTNHIFDIPEGYGEPYSVSIIPTRRQEHRERERLVSCGNARVEQTVGEPGTEEEEPYCGDGECNGDETCETCPLDCNVCPGGEIILLEDGFEGGDWDANWDDNYETDWSHAIDRKHGGSYSAENIGGFFIYGDDDLISDNLDASDADEIRIFFWYNKDDLDPNEFYIQIFDGNNYDPFDPFQDLDAYDGEDNCAGTSGDDKWCRFNETITSSEYFISNFRLKFEGTDTDNGESVWIDDVSIIKSY